ncbi:MAG: BamA/TamA family outer membrane protein [Ignavibacteriales bacterium]|nr:BamA/TamA family outer membrane protein [Ignavibacteriales bacterium]
MKIPLLSATLALFCLNAARSFQDSVDTTRAESQGILPIPIAYYTPETGLAGGAGLLYFFRPEESNARIHPSTTALFLIYTERKQFIAQLSGEWYLQEGLWRIDGDFLFMRYPQKFFGIGNNTSESAEENYISRVSRTEFKVLRSLFPGLNLGLTGLLESRKLSDLLTGGLLSTKSIAGSTGGVTAGMGPLMTYDTRDNVFAPEQGHYHLLSVVGFSRGFGSDYAYTKTVVNVRRYLPLGEHQVLALQFFGTFISGSPPFHKLAELGGQESMRGYFEGRFRDRHYLTTQAEYRTPLFWRIGFVAFAGVGEVAHEVGQFSVKGIKPSYGLGFRYFFNLQEKLNLRVDFGFGNNSSGLYIGPAEAF